MTVGQILLGTLFVVGIILGFWQYNYIREEPYQTVSGISAENCSAEGELADVLCGAGCAEDVCYETSVKKYRGFPLTTSSTSGQDPPFLPSTHHTNIFILALGLPLAGYLLVLAVRSITKP